MTRRPNSRVIKVLRTIVRERDGDNCWYCDAPMDFIEGEISRPNRVTLEHLIDLCNGGTNDLVNLALAHEKCNCTSNHLSLEQKWKRKKRLTNRTRRREVMSGLIEPWHKRNHAILREHGFESNVKGAWLNVWNDSLSARASLFIEYSTLEFECFDTILPVEDQLFYLVGQPKSEMSLDRFLALLVEHCPRATEV
jgi:iron-sulfur cluster repair protein YtfE (RIC family)